MTPPDRTAPWERFRNARVHYRMANEELLASLKQLWLPGYSAQICYRGDYELSCTPVTIIGVIDHLSILVKNDVGERLTVHPNDLYDK